MAFCHYNCIGTNDAHLAFADIDGDGDQDLLRAEYLRTINYFENTGSSSLPAFQEREWNNMLNMEEVWGPWEGPYALSTADINTDGDIEIFVNAPNSYGFGEQLQFTFENTGSPVTPQFDSPTVEVLDFNGIIFDHHHIDFCDIDGDADMDMVGALGNGGAFLIENIGNHLVASFGTAQFTPNNLTGL